MRIIDIDEYRNLLDTRGEEISHAHWSTLGDRYQYRASYIDGDLGIYRYLRNADTIRDECPPDLEEIPETARDEVARAIRGLRDHYRIRLTIPAPESDEHWIITALREAPDEIEAPMFTFRQADHD